MTGLGLAKIDGIVAMQHRETLYLGVVGKTIGFDGGLQIVKSNTRIYPPAFDVFCIPGNCGFSGVCVEREAVVGGAFAGTYRKIQVRGANGVKFPLILSVPDPLPLPVPSASTTRTLAAPIGVDSDDDFGWHAWINMMPPGPKTLHVRGKLMMPTPGYTLELSKKDPQSSNSGALVLDLTETPPTGVAPQVLTPATVEFEETPAQQLYSSVHIRNTDVVFPVTAAF